MRAFREPLPHGRHRTTEGKLTRFDPYRRRVCFRRLRRWKHNRAAPGRLNSPTQDGALLLFLCILLSGCRSPQGASKPSIVFDKVPPADVGGLQRLETIEGRVLGARPGQQIVLYSRSEQLWWVQPFSNLPFTRIESDFTWKNQIHPGAAYAALLVDQGYNPAGTAEELPAADGGVVLVAVSKGQGPAPTEKPPKILHFSGYDWTVRSAASYRGGSHNSFDPANAWTDVSGALHLRISKSQDEWTCAEVKLTHSLGYGTYVFVVRDTAHLEPSAVLTLFTWDGVGSEQNRRELDVEISRWGYLDNDNVHYVVQPYYIPTNVVRFRVPAGVFTHSFRWKPGEVMFWTVAGSPNTSRARSINRHTFTSGVPVAGAESVRMNLYVFGKGVIPQKGQNEVVIDKFEFLP